MDLREIWCELDSSGSEQGHFGGSCEGVNEYSAFIKTGKFLEYLVVLSHFQEGLCSLQL